MHNNNYLTDCKKKIRIYISKWNILYKIYIGKYNCNRDKMSNNKL